MKSTTRIIKILLFQDKLIYVDLPDVSNGEVDFVGNVLLVHGSIGRSLTSGHLTASSSIGILRTMIGAHL